MSHSTTATSTYVLSKYSKSYPNTPEWQHFMNPTIRLILDVKKGSDLESVRLRIVWSMDSSTPGSDQREVVFEDIDLLQLSCLPPSRASRQPAQGLPIKAVYRDTIVGIRYLHPSVSTLDPAYRRFQITFQSSSAVLQFIEAIRTICPCKANPGPTPVLKPPPSNIPGPYTQPGSESRIATAGLTEVASESLSAFRGTSFLVPPTGGNLIRSSDCASLSPTPASVITTLPDVQTHFPSSQNILMIPTPPGNMLSSSPLNLDSCVSAQPASSPPSVTAVSVPKYPYPTPIPSRVNEIYDATSNPRPAATINNYQPRTSLPESSPPEFFGGSRQAPPALHTNKTGDTSEFLSAISENTPLYDLPRSTLERLVGEVIREEGFTKLLQELDNLWSVKCVFGK